MEKRLRVDRLFDIYGPLLTEKRRNAMRLYLEEDLSLAEIGEETGVSRQGVHEAMLESEHKLENYESVLGILKREADIAEALELLSGVNASPDTRDALNKAVSLLDGTAKNGR